MWYKKILEYIFNQNRKRLKGKRKIKIAFIAGISDTWPGDLLYSKFASDSRFETEILIHPFNNGTAEMIKENFENVERFFKEKGYHFSKVNKWRRRCDLSWSSIGKPDILIHLNHYMDAFPYSLKIVNLPLSTLNVYIPYGFTVVDNSLKQFNLITHNLYWKTMGDSKMYLYLAKKYSDIKGTNVIYSGYTKMDTFMNHSKPLKSDNELWKIKGDSENQLKIIYAPHHSIGDIIPQFSTFDKNYIALYEYAKEHPDSTTWIIKPHPFLKKEAIKAGLFKNGEEFDQYLGMWDELPNAKTVIGGDYFDYFTTSDCMIQDSGSFIAEYLYVNKPMLLLTRKSQNFNALGKEIQKVIYQAEGDDIPEIKHFLEHTVHKDVLRKSRERLFQKYFNYTKENGGKLAGEYIYDYIVKSIFNQ